LIESAHLHSDVLRHIAETDIFAPTSILWPMTSAPWNYHGAIAHEAVPDQGEPVQAEVSHQHIKIDIPVVFGNKTVYQWSHAE